MINLKKCTHLDNKLLLLYKKNNMIKKSIVIELIDTSQCKIYFIKNIWCNVFYWL